MHSSGRGGREPVHWAASLIDKRCACVIPGSRSGSVAFSILAIARLVRTAHDVAATAIPKGGFADHYTRNDLC